MTGEDTVEVAALSWILELPRDLGLEEGLGASLMNNETQLAGWVGQHPELPDWSEGPLDAVPIKRLRFRRAYVDIGMPTAATDLAFGYLRRYESERKEEYEAGLRKRIEDGAKEWKTVCQLTRWYVGDGIPAPPEDPLNPGPDSPIRTDFAGILNDLDLWLQAYALSAGQIDVGTIALHDLPALVPWVVEIAASPQGPRSVVTGMLPIHSRLPNLTPAEGNKDAGRLASILMARGPGAFPFFTPLSLLYQSSGHSLAGRGRQAVIDMGTAVEAMVSTVITEVMRLRGHGEGEIEAIFEKRWKTIFNRDLLEILGVETGAGGAAHSRWWADAYRLRTKVVHAGEPVTQEQSAGAVASSWDLFEWIGERLRTQDDLVALGEAIRFQRPPPDDEAVAEGQSD